MARRVDGMHNATFGNHRIPAQWPAGDQSFDLIVVSEVCSFLRLTEIREVAQHCVESMAPDGLLVLCDWRWPFDARVTGADGAHGIFDGSALHGLVRHAEEDVLSSMWRNDPRSAARRESLA